MKAIVKTEQKLNRLISFFISFFKYLSFHNGALDVSIGLSVSDGVFNTNAVTFCQQPMVDQRLDCAVHHPGNIMTHLHDDDMKHGAR